MDPRVEKWLARDPDPKTRAELEGLVEAGNLEELGRRFERRLAFGTAGLRGLLGAGPGRMNRLVVQETTAGLGAYLLAQIPDARERGVVVGFDGRRGSRVFAEDTAAVLAALGIRTYLSDREIPTPACAFAVLHLGAAGGVVVTASHNPPDYNGYKVYWDNGAQIIPPHDAGIAAAIEAAAARTIPRLDPATARREGLIRSMGDELIEDYHEGVRSLSIHDGGPRDGLGIAYTALHGVGAEIAEDALARAGFTQVYTVADQREPDGTFPTVNFPNPEEPGAMDGVLALAREHQAALACANDPDADRLAVAVRNANGDYQMLTGNEIGVLLGADLIESIEGTVSVATTIVSSRLLGVIARARGAGYFETLTGFKWIANGALTRSSERFAFGYEEALGYTVGTLVRDKDGISALVAICELAADLARDELTLLDRLEAIYREHGLYLTAQQSLALSTDRPGPTVGEKLRATPPAAIAGRAIAGAVDLRTKDRGDLPASDVLIFHLEGGARVIVRPSGTEPKLKCYYEVRETVADGEAFADAEDRARLALEQLIAAHQAELRALE